MADFQHDEIKRLRQTSQLILLILAAAALYVARDLVLPIILAALLSLTFIPLVRKLKRAGIPEPLTSFLLIGSITVALATAIYFGSTPVSDMIAKAPEIGAELRSKLTQMSSTVEAVKSATEEVESMTEQVTGETTPKVIIKEPGILSSAADWLSQIGATIAISLVLTFFVLASSTLFHEKLISSYVRLSDKKRALQKTYEIEAKISRYLLTVTTINLCLGGVIAAGLWLYGFANPLIWGLLAAGLNFLPFIGALVGTVLITIFSILQFDTLSAALPVPLIYYSCTLLEGQIITPYILGKRLEFNTVAILLALTIWGWLWGVPGILISVPILVVIKELTADSERWSVLSNFISAKRNSEKT